MIQSRVVEVYSTILFAFIYQHTIRKVAKYCKMFWLTPWLRIWSPTRCGSHCSNASDRTLEALDYSISVILVSELAESKRSLRWELIWAPPKSVARGDGAKLFPKDLRKGLKDGLAQSTKFQNVQNMCKRVAGSCPHRSQVGSHSLFDLRVLL